MTHKAANLVLEKKPAVLDAGFLDNFHSPHTRRAYEKDLLQFLLFLEHHYPRTEFPQAVGREQVIAYRDHLIQKDGVKGEASAPKTIARKLASISSYYAYLLNQQHPGVSFNPTDSIKRPRVEVKYPTQALEPAQVQELFALIDQNKTSGPMHKALIVLLFTSGMRKSEVLGLKRKDYVMINDLMVLNYTAKGGKLRQKVVHPECAKVLDAYLDWCHAKGRGHQTEDWFFRPGRNLSDPGNIDKQLNPMTVNEILDGYTKKLGISFKIYPHSARATFITCLLGQGVPIADVAKEVGHSSVTTTQEYDKRREQLLNSPVLKLKLPSAA